jgi:hypothetical protein
MTTGVSVAANFERREPRCHVCREEALRLLVNRLLDWQGIPIPLGPRKFRKVTYADILRELEPINAQRDETDRISYDNLWTHAKRHYELAGVVAYRVAQLPEDLAKALARPKALTK